VHDRQTDRQTDRRKSGPGGACAWCRSYRVRVVGVSFRDRTMWEIVDTIRNAVLMVGMHGAGWTHAAFLRPGAAALQLVSFDSIDRNGAVGPKP
jgi:hypothetical protein